MLRDINIPGAQPLRGSAAHAFAASSHRIAVARTGRELKCMHPLCNNFGSIAAIAAVLRQSPEAEVIQLTLPRDGAQTRHTSTAHHAKFGARLRYDTTRKLRCISFINSRRMPTQRITRCSKSLVPTTSFRSCDGQFLRDANIFVVTGICGHTKFHTRECHVRGSKILRDLLRVARRSSRERRDYLNALAFATVAISPVLGGRLAGCPPRGSSHARRKGRYPRVRYL